MEQCGPQGQISYRCVTKHMGEYRYNQLQKC